MAGAAFLYEVHRLLRLSRGTGTDGTGDGEGLVTMRLFHLSILYLTLVFAAVAAGASSAEEALNKLKLD